MIGAILPPSVAWATLRHDPGDTVLFPEEEALMAHSVPSRRAEFATGRHCARLALADLGVPPGPIGAGPRGEPRWPGGIVGSLTHCASFRAAAVARRTDLLGLGIDAEPHAPLPDGILDAIALPEERSHLDQLAYSDQEFNWDRLLFSAKESIFKVCFPLAKRQLGFDEARIELGRSGRFTARLLVPGPRVHGRSLTGFTGRWMVGGGLALTAATVPVGGSADLGTAERRNEKWTRHGRPAHPE